MKFNSLEISLIFILTTYSMYKLKWLYNGNNRLHLLVYFYGLVNEGSTVRTLKSCAHLYFTFDKTGLFKYLFLIGRIAFRI